MKKVILIMLVGLFAMSFYTDPKNLEVNNSHKNISQQREVSIQAYVQMRTEWVRGYVFLRNGVVTRCQFPDIRAGGGVVLRAQIYRAVKPSYLNPNNPIAIENNFTHYVQIPNYGRAYFTL